MFPIQVFPSQIFDGHVYPKTVASIITFDDASANYLESLGIGYGLKIDLDTILFSDGQQIFNDPSPFYFLDISDSIDTNALLDLTEFKYDYLLDTTQDDLNLWNDRNVIEGWLSTQDDLNIWNDFEENQYSYLTNLEDDQNVWDDLLETFSDLGSINEDDLNTWDELFLGESFDTLEVEDFSIDFDDSVIRNLSVPGITSLVESGTFFAMYISDLDVGTFDDD